MYPSFQTAMSRVTNSRHAVFTVGLGGETDEDVLYDLGKTGYRPVRSASRLSTTFDTLAQDIRDLSNSYYALTYCSPCRAGEHDLRVRARDYWHLFGWKLFYFKGYDFSIYMKHGDAYYDFDASGFRGGCSTSVHQAE